MRRKRVRNRRGSGRLRHALLTRYRLVDAMAGAALCPASTVDVSVGGAYLATSDPPPPGTPLVVLFRTALDGPDIEVPCEVRWVGGGDGLPTGMGVRFDGLGRKQQRRLHAYLSWLGGFDGDAAGPLRRPAVDGWNLDHWSLDAVP